MLGFAAGTTFYGSITVSLRAREALLPALAFPILVPVVIATVRATAGLLEGLPPAEVWPWLIFLTAFDLGTIILATLLFPYAVEGKAPERRPEGRPCRRSAFDMPLRSVIIRI